MSIFIVGATGRVGGAVMRELRGRQLLKAAAQQARVAESGIEWVPFSLDNPRTFPLALSGVKSVFLMRPPQITRKSAFLPFLDAVRRAEIKRVVALSVMGAERNPLLPHHGMEQAIIERGFDWTMVRPSDFMQNLETVHLRSIQNEHEIAVPAGRGRSAFVDVADLGVVIARLLTEAGHTERGYTLTGPASLSFATVAQTLTEQLGRPIRYRSVGIPTFLWEQLRAGAPLGISLVMSALYTVQRLGLADRATNDLARLLGRPPGTLKDYVARSKALWLGEDSSPRRPRSKGLPSQVDREQPAAVRPMTFGLCTPASRDY